MPQPQPNYSYTVSSNGSDETFAYQPSAPRRTAPHCVLKYFHNTRISIEDDEPIWVPRFWSALSTSRQAASQSGRYKESLQRDLDEFDERVHWIYNTAFQEAIDSVEPSRQHLTDFIPSALGRQHRRSFDKGDFFLQAMTDPNSPYYSETLGIDPHHREVASGLVRRRYRERYFPDSTISANDVLEMLTGALNVADGQGNVLGQHIPQDISTAMTTTMQQIGAGNPSTQERAALSALTRDDFRHLCRVWAQMSASSISLPYTSRYQRVSGNALSLLRNHVTMRHLPNIYLALLETREFEQRADEAVDSVAYTFWRDSDGTRCQVAGASSRDDLAQLRNSSRMLAINRNLAEDVPYAPRHQPQAGRRQ